MLRHSLYVIAFFVWLGGLAWADLVLRWQDNSAVETRYEVLRQRQNEKNFNLVATLPSNTTTWVDRGTRRNQRYCYLVVAYLNTERSFSNVACQKDDGRAAPIAISWGSFTGSDTQLVVDQQ